MTTRIKLPIELCRAMRVDLARSHPFAAERVGFAYGRPTIGGSGRLVLLYAYEPVADDDYVDDRLAGATYGTRAIRGARQRILARKDAAFHVHAHDHSGRPWFSAVDRASLNQVVPSFLSIARDIVHGALLLSDDSIAALVWTGGKKPEIASVTVVAYPMQVIP